MLALVWESLYLSVNCDNECPRLQASMALRIPVPILRWNDDVKWQKGLIKYEMVTFIEECTQTVTCISWDQYSLLHFSSTVLNYLKDSDRLFLYNS